MKYNLTDDHVKRIAAMSFHKGGSAHRNISDTLHLINTPETLDTIAQAHTLDAMNHKFKHQDDENLFKRHFATAAAINRGTLHPLPPTEVGQAAP